MERGKNQGGSVTLLFAVILLCIALLSVLSVATARADWAVTENYGDFVRRSSSCENALSRWLAETDGALRRSGSAVTAAELPPNTTRQGDVLSYSVTLEGICGEAALRIDRDGGYEVLLWRRQALWEQDTTLELWQE